MYLIK